MTTGSTTKTEANWRAAATDNADPTTPAGFLRLFDVLAFERLMDEGLVRARDAGRGLSVRRKQDRGDMSGYFEAAMRCAGELQDQLVSPAGIVETVAQKVRTLNLRAWFAVSVTDDEPDGCSTHFMRFHNRATGGAQETVELLPDMFMSADAVRAHCAVAFEMQRGEQKRSAVH